MAKYYDKYKKQLNAAGYTIDNDGMVWDANGNQAAGEDRFGNVQSKDPNVTQICKDAEASTFFNKAKKVVIPKKKKAKL